MAKNRSKHKPQTDPSDLRPIQAMMGTLAECMATAAEGLQLQVSGQATIEGGDISVIVLHTAYPNGDMMLWFLYRGFYTVMSLVNKKLRHCSQIPASSPEVFQEELDKLKEILGK